MTPAELEAARRLLFLSIPEAAAGISQTTERAWRLWESGARLVPDDVSASIRALLSWREHAIAATQAVIADHGGSPALVWYAHPEQMGVDVAQWRAHQSVCASLMASHGAWLVVFQPEAYRAWLAEHGRADSQQMRSMWAAQHSPAEC